MKSMELFWKIKRILENLILSKELLLCWASDVIFTRRDMQWTPDKLDTSYSCKYVWYQLKWVDEYVV